MDRTSESCEAVCDFEESRGTRCHESATEAHRALYQKVSVKLCWTHKAAAMNKNRTSPLEFAT